MRIVWAGVILFVVMTALASLAFNIVDFADYTPPGPNSLVIFTPSAIVVVNSIIIGLATLPATLLMMLAAAIRRWRGPLAGVASIVVVLLVFCVLMFLDMALSPYEVKRAQQWSAVTISLTGLGYILPSYLLTYFVLRRTRPLAPLLATATPVRSA